MQIDDIFFGRKTVRNDVFGLVDVLKYCIRSKIKTSIVKGTVAFTTDLWSDNIVQRSYLDIYFIWVETNPIDDTVWSIGTAIFACRSLKERKTAYNIKACIDGILIEARCEPDDIRVTTDKEANTVAVTSQKQQLNCTCHRLNTTQEKAWESITMSQSDIGDLYEKCRKLVTFAKTPTNI